MCDELHDGTEREREREVRERSSPSLRRLGCTRLCRRRYRSVDGWKRCLLAIARNALRLLSRQRNLKTSLCMYVSSLYKLHHTCVSTYMYMYVCACACNLLMCLSMMGMSSRTRATTGRACGSGWRGDDGQALSTFFPPSTWHMHVYVHVHT